MNKNEISVRNILHSIVQHLPIILAAMLVFGAASWAFTRFLVKPKYAASAKMIAISNIERTGEVYTTAEHNAAVALVNTSAEVMKTDKVLQVVSERLKENGLDYSSSKLKSMISISSQNETEVFIVRVSGTVRKDLPLITNTLCEVAEEKVGDIIKAGSTSILETSNSASLVSPNIRRNTILGTLIGMLLAMLYVIIRDLYDTTIWTEDDLTDHYDVPVLGLIPQLMINDAQQKAKE